VLRAVNPGPTPRMTRPGASSLMVAIALAVTGVAATENADERPQLDALGVVRGQRHRGEHVAVKHLGVVEPRVGEAVLLGQRDVLPRPNE
jgi:hypothetical protein